MTTSKLEVKLGWFDEALREELLHIKPSRLRDKLIQDGKLEELKDKDYLRVPMELPQRNE